MSDYWIKPRPEYYVQTGSMLDNPVGVPRDEVIRYIKNNPPEVVAQVVFGKYVESSGLVFTAEVINGLFDRSYDKVLDEVWLDKERWRQGLIEQKANFNPYRYYTGVDLARKKDYTVIFTIDTKGASVSNPARVVYYRRTNRVPWPTIYAEIGKAHLHLFPGECLIDGTGSGGDVILEELENRLYCPAHHITFTADTECPALKRGEGCKPNDWRRFNVDSFTFTSGSKVQLVNHLQAVLGSGYDASNPERPFGLLRCPPIYQLEEELSDYAWDDKKLETDCVFGLALAAWAGLEDPVQPILHESVYGSR